MVIIGIDPHKRTHTASALEPGTQRVLGSVQVEASLAGYRQLWRWAARFDQRRWAVENAHGLGHHLAQWLLARGERVEDVPSTATARVRELSRGRRRKTDVIDAAAAASVAALGGEAQQVLPEGLTTTLALLDERRTNLVNRRTRLINQLHALLRDLIPGGVPTDLTAAQAAKALTGLRPVGLAETTRKQLARDMIDEIRDIDTREKKITAQITKAVAEHGTQLPTIPGIGPVIGPVIAARLLGRTEQASRFPTASAFAAYAGVAPIEIASADRSRHRLSRGGDRQLNHALHLAVVTQIRMPNTAGRTYYDRKITEGKTHKEALRCLKRRLADRVWRTMIADERPQPIEAANPGGQPGTTQTSSAAGSNPNTSPSDKSQPGPATTQPTTPNPTT